LSLWRSPDFLPDQMTRTRRAIASAVAWPRDAPHQSGISPAELLPPRQPLAQVTMRRQWCGWRGDALTVGSYLNSILDSRPNVCSGFFCLGPRHVSASGWPSSVVRYGIRQCRAHSPDLCRRPSTFECPAFNSSSWRWLRSAG
jgi:hypothetical protein